MSSHDITAVDGELYTAGGSCTATVICSNPQQAALVADFRFQSLNEGRLRTKKIHKNVPKHTAVEWIFQLPVQQFEFHPADRLLTRFPNGIQLRRSHILPARISLPPLTSFLSSSLLQAFPLNSSHTSHPILKYPVRPSVPRKLLSSAQNLQEAAAVCSIREIL